MNADLKKRWIEALRSGKYTQGTTYLNYQGKQCCLGVLCLIENEKTSYSPGNPMTLLSSEQRAKFGLSDHMVNKCIAMNDGMLEGRIHSFSEIADWLKANLRTND